MGAKLGDILISQGVIDHEKLIAALSDQRAFGGKLGRTLVDLGYVSEEQLLRALSAARFGHRGPRRCRRGAGSAALPGGGCLRAVRRLSRARRRRGARALG